MSILKIISSYATYNLWANDEVSKWLQSLDEHLLLEEMASSFRTIIGTIEHMSIAQEYWLDFITRKDVSNFNWNIIKRNTSEVFKNLMEVSVRMEKDFSSFDESQLTTILSGRPKEKNLSRYDYIMHVINHGTYHRGQIITMARSLGVTHGIPKTDYNLYLSEMRK